MYIVSHIAAAIPEKGILSEWLYHWLSTVDFSHYAHATTLPSLPFSKIKHIAVPVAPRTEQTRIADTLDELFSDLDAGVAALKRARNKLKLYRASVLKAAVEGALTADWRKQHPDAEPASELLKHVLAERRRRWEEDQLRKFEEKGKAPPKNWKAKYKEPVAPDTASLPSLPEGWCWATVAQIGETITGFTPSTNNPDFFGDDVPFFKPTDLDQGYYLKDYRKSLSNEGARIGRLLPALSILVTCIGATIGKLGLARVDCTCNQQINALITNDTLLSPHYIYWFLASPFGQRAVIRNASATTLPILNKSRFQTLPIAISPIAEQKAIVEIVENQLSVTDRLEADIDAKLQSAQTLRQSILKHAFTGKLAPQDPHDEPAAELLKRIAAERTARTRQSAAAKNSGSPRRRRQRAKTK